MLCAPTRLGSDLLTGLLFGLDSVSELHTGPGLGDLLGTAYSQPPALHALGEAVGRLRAFGVVGGEEDLERPTRVLAIPW